MQTAAQAHAAVVLAIRQKIVALESILAEAEARDPAKINWGTAGDLGRLDAWLADALAPHTKPGACPMNAKKAKRLRQALRRIGVAISECSYTADSGRSIPVPTGQTDSMGKPIVRPAFITGTVRLNPKCGRAQYLQTKRMNTLRVSA
jgi:hypothetical protein